MTEVIKTEVKKDTDQEVDVQLVDKACNTITEIFSKHFEDAVLKTGEYLIREFFGNDFEKAKGKEKEIIDKSPKKGSLSQVFDHFKRDTSKGKSDETPKNPSKSWLYQSIQFVIQENDLKKGLDDKSFQTYGKLLLSQKVVLLSVKILKEKEILINRAYDKSLTVRALKDEISKNNNSSKRVPGILSIINKPEYFDSDECQDKFTLESLKEEGHSKLLKLPKKIEEKQQLLNTELEEFKKKIADNNEYLKKLDELKPTVEKAIKDTEGNSRNGKAKSN
jgi:hypothetical protein